MNNGAINGFNSISNYVKLGAKEVNKNAKNNNYDDVNIYIEIQNEENMKDNDYKKKLESGKISVEDVIKAFHEGKATADDVKAAFEKDPEAANKAWGNKKIDNES